MVLIHIHLFVMIDLIQLQYGVFAINSPLEHGEELSAIHDLLPGIGGTLLHYIGEVIIKCFYSNHYLHP